MATFYLKNSAPFSLKFIFNTKNAKIFCFNRKEKEGFSSQKRGEPASPIKNAPEKTLGSTNLIIKAEFNLQQQRIRS